MPKVLKMKVLLIFILLILTRLDQLAHSLEGPLAGERRREEWVERALCAEHVFEENLHYLIRDGAVQIIDLPTGRRAPDRAFESGVPYL